MQYKIMFKNFKTPKGEIDIIAKDKNEIVFVEVKTRKNNKFGYPIESVNKTKQIHIKNVSNYFIYTNKMENNSIRYDVIEIYVLKNKFFINHIKNLLW